MKKSLIYYPLILFLQEKHVSNKYYILLIAIESADYVPQRRLSKISIQMEKIQQEIKEYDEFIKNEIEEDEDIYDELDEEFDCSEIDFHIKKQYYNNSDCNFINFKSFKVYFYFEINKDCNFIFPIESDIFNAEKQYIYELLKNIVKLINNKNIVINNNNIKYNISLKDCEDNNDDFYINNYELKPCKKTTFVPKFDLPSYSAYSLLTNIAKERISFVSKNPLNIMLIQIYEEKKSENEHFQNKSTDKYGNNFFNDKKIINNNKEILLNKCIIY